MKRLIFLATALLMSACAQAPKPHAETHWMKEGVSKQAMQDQLGYCRHDVEANDKPKDQADRLIGYCMRSNGYEQVTQIVYR